MSSPKSVRRLAPGIVALALGLLPGVAVAQTPLSLDAEFIRPTFGADSFSGVDVATQTKPRTLRFGTALMYTRNPVTLWDRLANDGNGEEIGSIVGHRASIMLGLSYDLSSRLTLNAMLPAAVNSAGEEGDPKDFEAPGVGLQDIGIGGRLTMIRYKDDVFNLGLRAGVIFPSGTAEAYLGDGGIRPHAALLASVKVGRTLVATEVGSMIRTETRTTQEDLVIGSELIANLAVRHKLPDATRLGVSAQLLTKSGFENFLAGGGENAMEALGGIEIYPSRMATFDISAGRGFTRGYATTDLRVLAGLKFEWAPKAEPPLILDLPPPMKAPVPEVIPEDPEPEPEDKGLIIVSAEEIKVKDKLEFVVGTTTLLDASRPTLKAVADFVNETWQIRNMEIVGHASAEGTYEYNYNLSQGRARTIWQELIQYGVHPDRISYKGLGEVVPLTAAKLGREPTEAELQDNRRVEFNIIRRYDELEEEPFKDFQSTVLAPWNGNPIRVVVPVKPEPEKPAEDPDVFETFGKDDLEDDGMNLGEEP